MVKFTILFECENEQKQQMIMFYMLILMLFKHNFFFSHKWTQQSFRIVWTCVNGFIHQVGNLPWEHTSLCHSTSHTGISFSYLTVEEEANEHIRKRRKRDWREKFK